MPGAAHDNRRFAAVLVMVAGTIVGVLLLALGTRYQSDVAAWVREDPQTRFRLLIVVLILVTSGPVLAAAVYLWRFARQFDARPRSVMQGIAAVLASAAVGLAIVLWQFVLQLNASIP
jgi:hypothetical protein